MWGNNKMRTVAIKEDEKHTWCTCHRMIIYKDSDKHYSELFKCSYIVCPKCGEVLDKGV